MRVIIENGKISMPVESEEDRSACDALEPFADHVYELHVQPGQQLIFVDLGAREDLKPINIMRGIGQGFAPISNLAETPFELDGEPYGSVEGFWQSLKFTDEADRRRVGLLSGPRAKQTGDSSPAAPITFEYGGRTIVRGTWGHWALMERACDAKFTQHDGARVALLATGERPLTHRAPRDSRTIPGVVMAEIWMRVRTRLRRTTARRADR